MPALAHDEEGDAPQLNDQVFVQAPVEVADNNSNDLEHNIYPKKKVRSVLDGLSHLVKSLLLFKWSRENNITSSSTFFL